MTLTRISRWYYSNIKINKPKYVHLVAMNSLRKMWPFLLHKTILRPIWTYGIPLWGTTSQSNLEILQRFQNKVLRTIANAPRYVPNSVLHTDLSIPTVREEITKLIVAHKDKQPPPKPTTTYPTRGTRNETAQTLQPMWSATQILLKCTSYGISIKWRVLTGTRLIMPCPYSPCLYW
jgi:hypothetical protein